MDKKHKDFSQLVAAQFKDMEFAKAYLLNLIKKDNYALEDALKHTIQEIGATNFSKSSQFSKEEIEQYLKGSRSFSLHEQQNIIENVFKIKTKLILESI